MAIVLKAIGGLFNERLPILDPKRENSMGIMMSRRRIKRKKQSEKAKGTSEVKIEPGEENAEIIKKNGPGRPRGTQKKGS
jgi:hypothetical protein